MFLSMFCSGEALWALMRNIPRPRTTFLSRERNLVRGAFRSNLSVSVEKPFVLRSGEKRCELRRSDVLVCDFFESER